MQWVSSQKEKVVSLGAGWTWGLLSPSCKFLELQKLVELPPPSTKGEQVLLGNSKRCWEPWGLSSQAHSFWWCQGLGFIVQSDDKPTRKMCPRPAIGRCALWTRTKGSIFRPAEWYFHYWPWWFNEDCTSFCKTFSNKITKMQFNSIWPAFFLLS